MYHYISWSYEHANIIFLPKLRDHFAEFLRRELNPVILLNLNTG